jgi:hypothetical protein
MRLSAVGQPFLGDLLEEGDDLGLERAGEHPAGSLWSSPGFVDTL